MWSGSLQCIKTRSTKLKTYEFWNKKKLSNWIQSDYNLQWNISQIELYWLVISIPCTYCQYWHIDNIIWYHLFSQAAALMNPPSSYWQMTLAGTGHEPSFHFFGVAHFHFGPPCPMFIKTQSSPCISFALLLWFEGSFGAQLVKLGAFPVPQTLNHKQ